MEKEKKYSRVFFSVNSLKNIFEDYQKIVEDPSKTKLWSLSIKRANEVWNYDHIEEFFSEARRAYDLATMIIHNEALSLVIQNYNLTFTEIATSAKVESSLRENIIRLGNKIDECAEKDFVARIEQVEKAVIKPKIFVGHGNSEQWRDLKDHLTDKHGYEVLAYETGSRAGHTIRDVISDLMNKSSFAILVMTGEDKLEDGKVRARQNVIHEIGLFQGKLGFTKAIVLKEDGTEEFSNINGIHQIRYSKGNIKETFGDVLATLAREFGNVN